MHAVVVTVRIAEGKFAEAEQLLTQMVVPQVKSEPGFVSGTWLSSEDQTTGHSLVVFDTKDHAEAASKNVAPPPGSPISIAYTQVYEVRAQA
jgi:quinol monooxygenase YgiN